jgi:hypothetical protein
MSDKTVGTVLAISGASSRLARSLSVIGGDKRLRSFAASRAINDGSSG